MRKKNGLLFGLYFNGVYEGVFINLGMVEIRILLLIIFWYYLNCIIGLYLFFKIRNK